MQDYSYNELMQMQEQAIRRVKEMQKRARVSVGEDIPDDEGNTVHESIPPSAENFAFENENVKESATEKEVHSFHAENGRSESARDRRSMFSGFSELMERFTVDSDTALILPLLLLLAKEGTDKKLLLALLYIMG